MSYPTDLQTLDTSMVGTSVLSSPDHALAHREGGSIANNLQIKLGVGAGSPVVDKALIGSGNGTSGWAQTWNNATLGTPTIGSPALTGGTLTGNILNSIFPVIP